MRLLSVITRTCLLYFGFIVLLCGALSADLVRLEVIDRDGSEMLGLHVPQLTHDQHHISLDLIGTLQFDEQLMYFCKDVLGNETLFADLKVRIHKERMPELRRRPPVDPAKDGFSYVIDQFSETVLRIEMGRGTVNFKNLKVLWWGDMTTGLSIGRYTTLSNEIMVFLGGNHCYRDVSTFPFDIIFHVDRITSMSSKCKKEWFNDAGSYSNGPVKIGSDVHIGEGTTISSGVIIGDGSIVKPHSIIRSNVPPFAIVAGNPSVVVGYRYTASQISSLLNIKWWDWSPENVSAAADSLLFDDVSAFISKFGTK